jgi:hypothetical protein
MVCVLACTLDDFCIVCLSLGNPSLKSQSFLRYIILPYAPLSFSLMPIPLCHFSSLIYSLYLLGVFSAVL